MRTPRGLGLAFVALALVAGELAPASHAAPAAWDPGVAPVARRVEQLRGLKFEHPVPVVTLDDDEYRARVQPVSAEPTSAQRKALELLTARLDHDTLDSSTSVVSDLRRRALEAEVACAHARRNEQPDRTA